MTAATESDEQFVERITGRRTDGEFKYNLVLENEDADRALALMRRGAAVQWREPTESECANAALSYRHDYGLLSDAVRKYVRGEARHWLYAWWKNIEMIIPPPAKEQSDDK